MNIKEMKYSSSIGKMVKNADLLKKISEEKKFIPQTIQLIPTEVCNLNCSFCSLKNKQQTQLSLEQIKKILDDFKSLGAKAVEITGGGEPTLHPQINEIINYAYDNGFKIGMISNGTMVNKKINYDNLKKLTWLRISLNCLDQVPSINLDIPNNVSLGFSYVWNEKGTPELLKRINDMAEKHNVKFVRIVPNCLSISEIKKARKEIPNLIKDYPRFFFQSKDYQKPFRCWFGLLKPYVYSDGFVYRCSACALIEQKMPEKFRMCKIEDIKSFWAEHPMPFDTKSCGECFFKEQNDLIEALLTKFEHSEFL